MNNYINIFIIRHGESIANKNSIIERKCADKDVPLTDNGLKGCKPMGKFLKSNFNINSQNSMLFCSPYKRTYETAKAIQKHTKLNIIKDDRLVSRNKGMFTGLNEREIFSLYPKEAEWFFLNKKWHNSYFTKEPMGESPLEVSVRLHSFLDDLMNCYIKSNRNLKNIMIVSHSSTINILLKIFLNKDEKWIEQQPESDNCAIRLLKFDRYNNLSEDKKFIF